MDCKSKAASFKASRLVAFFATLSTVSRHFSISPGLGWRVVMMSLRVDQAVGSLGCVIVGAVSAVVTSLSSSSESSNSSMT